MAWTRNWTSSSWVPALLASTCCTSCARSACPPERSRRAAAWVAPGTGTGTRARCDVESIDYTYSFSEELQREWRWSERYPAQPEILRYLNFVADRFHLRRDIQFETRRVGHLRRQTNRWVVTTDQGDVVRAHLLRRATGCLSTPKDPASTALRSSAAPRITPVSNPTRASTSRACGSGSSAPVPRRFNPYRRSQNRPRSSPCSNAHRTSASPALHRSRPRAVE